MPRRPQITAPEALREREAARDNWNRWASAHKEERMRYEEKFMRIDRTLDDYEKRLALENLCMHEEKRVFDAAAKFWFEMWYWEDYCGAIQADKLIVDPTLNDEPYWWKVTSGRTDKIHHEHEPMKGTVFSIPREAEQTPLGSFTVKDTRASVL